MSYDEYRKIKIASGVLFQDFAIDLLYTVGLPIVQYASQFYQTHVGESRTGVEIKHDEKYATTGNLWIEVAEKARPRPGAYAESGIHRTDNSWLYVIGDYDTIFVFAKTHLQALKESGRYELRENHTKTSVGYLLPNQMAMSMAIMILRPQAECKVVKAVKDLHELGRRLHELVKGNGRQFSLFQTGDNEDK